MRSLPTAYPISHASDPLSADLGLRLGAQRITGYRDLHHLSSPQSRGKRTALADVLTVRLALRRDLRRALATTQEE
jgi:hypothetical protein